MPYIFYPFLHYRVFNYSVCTQLYLINSMPRYCVFCTMYTIHSVSTCFGIVYISYYMQYTLGILFCLFYSMYYIKYFHPVYCPLYHIFILYTVYSNLYIVLCLLCSVYYTECTNCTIL